MASRAQATTALILGLNLLFFSLVSGCQPKQPCYHHNGGYHRYPKCPRQLRHLGVCANVLGLVNVVIGSPPTLPCCSAMNGLADIEAAVCLCSAIKANVLGINLNVLVSINTVLGCCGKKVPPHFRCY